MKEWKESGGMEREEEWREKDKRMEREEERGERERRN